MRSSGWTPSIVPRGDDETVYLVTDDLGTLGSVWREADVETTDLETVITDLLTGQYSDPVRVIAFNTVKRWSQDVSEDVAHELRRRYVVNRPFNCGLMSSHFLASLLSTRHGGSACPVGAGRGCGDGASAAYIRLLVGHRIDGPADASLGSWSFPRSPSAS